MNKSLLIYYMKRCSKCREEKDRSCFSSNSRKKDKLCNCCKNCHKAYRRKHYLGNKATEVDRVRQHRREIHDWFLDYKIGLTCSICGEDHPATIDFHHMSNDKEFNVGEAARKGYSKERILKEIAKCKVVCSNCHRKLHWPIRLAVRIPAFQVDDKGSTPLWATLTDCGASRPRAAAHKMDGTTKKSESLVCAH